MSEHTLVGWTEEAFNNFIDGLIDQNFTKPNSLKAQQILNYILHEDNIKEFYYTLSSGVLIEIKDEIRTKIKLHEFAVKYVNLSIGDLLPTLIKRILIMEILIP